MVVELSSVMGISMVKNKLAINHNLNRKPAIKDIVGRMTEGQVIDKAAIVHKATDHKVAVVDKVVIDRRAAHIAISHCVEALVDSHKLRIGYFGCRNSFNYYN